MAKAFDTWNVLSHGPVVELAENLRSVAYRQFPGMPLERRMTVAKLASGGLVLHNPVALEEAEMKKLEAWGEPAYIVTPNGYHRLDTPNFRRRYPDAKVVCPRGAKKKVEVAPADLTYAEVPADAAVRFEHLDGVAESEGVVHVKSADGVTLIFNDVLFNVPKLPGFTGFVMGLMGSTGGPKVTLIGRMFVVKDKKALRAHLERLALPEVCRLIPGHGDVVTQRAHEVLKEVAGRL